MAADVAEPPSMKHGCIGCGLLGGTPMRDALVDFLLIAPLVVAVGWCCLRAMRYGLEKLRGGREHQE